MYRLLKFFLISMSPVNLQATEITTGIDEQAKLPYWQYQNGVISIRYIQRLPDQTRGTFLARGFSTKDADLIAQSCVFQTIFRNISDKSESSPIDYDMTSWQIIHNNKVSKIKTREDWAIQWAKSDVPPPAKLAFNWGLIPSTQHYQPGDYNWGMTTFNLAYGNKFDLKLSWKQSGKQLSIIIPAMQCAADIHPDPEE